MKKLILFFWIFIFCCSNSFAQSVPTQKKLTDNERMAWWRDAGFGMFIHWGLYAVPGGVYKGKTVRGNAEWIMDKLDIPVKEYEQFAGQFNPVKFDAKEWVSIAKNAGMKYIVITSKHHDGFCLWDSEVTDYDVMNASPFKRDIIKELAEACKKEGIKFCFYHSIVDWHHPQAQAPLFPNYNAGQRDQSVFNPEFPEYYKNYLKPQVKELLTNYGDIGVVWFDGDWIPDYTSEMGKELYQYIRELQPNTIINNRVDKGRTGMAGMNREGNFAGDFGTPEKEIPDTGIEGVDWESCLTMNNTWGFKSTDHNWKSTETLIHNLIDIVSKGGNLLLNVGPTAEGLIPEPSVERLRVMGDWLQVNGGAIYGAQASPFDKPSWGRYTSKQGILYAHVFDWPANGRLVIDKSVKIIKASLLADADGSLAVATSTQGDVVLLPETVPDSITTVIKLEVIPAEDWANLSRYRQANTQLGSLAPEEKRVVFMGNSITQAWARMDPNFFQSNGYIGRGISGQTTAQMLIRFRPDVIDLKPKAVVILAGTNDIAANRGPVPLEQIAGNIFSMAELAKANSIKVVLASVLPANSYGWRPAIAPADEIIKLNEMIRAYAKAHELVYLDYYSPLVDQNKGLKEKYGNDSVHPNLDGYKVMEPLVKRAIDKALKN